MVTAPTLAFDVTATLAGFALPGLLWLFLYLFAWERPGVAEVAGFGRFTFWLLLAGGVVGTLADLPFFGWQSDVLAVNIGGGVIPVVLGLYLLNHRLAPARTYPLVLYVGIFATASASALAYEFSSANQLSLSLVALGIGTGIAVLTVGALTRTRNPSEGQAFPSGSVSRVVAALALTGLAAAMTFVTTVSIPNAGILSAFPLYLVSPAIVGILSVPVVKYIFRRPLEEAFGIAYGATTMGVLVGADVLRQPPLYGHGPALFAIGGGGLLDLLYLSGLLAVFVTFLTTRVPPWHLSLPQPPPTPATEASPLLNEGAQLLSARGPQETVLRADAAVSSAIRRTREIMGLPATESDPARWNGIPAPGWLVVDGMNLASAARRARPEDGPRSLWAARRITGFLTYLAHQRLASLGQRIEAFLLDLVTVGVPAGLAVALYASITQASLSDIASSVGFTTIVLGIATYGFAYFVLSEWLGGRTLGKALMGILVTDTHLGAPSGMQVLQRNIPKLLPLTFLAYGVSVTALIPFAVGNLGAAFPFIGFLTAAVVLGLTAVGIGLVGLVSFVACNSDPERRRLGDRWAATLVIRRRAMVGALPQIPSPAPATLSG